MDGSDDVGTFGHEETLAVGASPFGAVVFDLEGDGDPDMAVANEGSSNVAVVENLGGRSFARAVLYPLLDRPNFVAAADLDLDGHPDLVLANRDSVRVAFELHDREEDQLLELTQI